MCVWQISTTKMKKVNLKIFFKRNYSSLEKIIAAISLLAYCTLNPFFTWITVFLQEAHMLALSSKSAGPKANRIFWFAVVLGKI